MTVRLIEWQVPYTWGTAIEITADKVINLLLRAENNLLHVNDDNELYCDLQLENWISTSDDLPVWVTTGIVNASDWRPQNGLLLHYETTSWAYAQRLYGGDWKLYFNWWTWERKLVYYAEDVDQLLQELHDELVEQLTMHAWEWISIQTVDDYSAMRWPCPEWYHVPTHSNILSISNIFGNLWIRGSTWAGYVSIPKSWYYWISWGKEHVNDWAYVWTCKNSWAWDRSWVWNWQDWVPVSKVRNSMWIPVRPFKNIPIIPNNQWNVIYDWSSIANWAWIFHSPELWVFSLSWNGQDWITIADKNIWATTIYHTGDQISADNSWYYYQWWNNHWFSYNGWFSTSNTKVDVSSYSPSSYSNNVFITWNDSWMIEINKDLWGWETWVQQITNTIINTWVLSVNWKKWHVIVADNVKAFRLENNQDLDTAQEIYERWVEWKEPIVIYKDNQFADGYRVYYYSHNDWGLVFISVKPTGIYYESSWYDSLYLSRLNLSIMNERVISINKVDESILDYIRLNTDYPTPYIPPYAWSPATKKYVDDHDVYIWTTAPTDNLVEWRLWYDTTNDVLKSYDWTNWNLVWDDTVNINTKTFYVADSNDLTTAQEAMDWFLAWKNPIIVYDNQVYLYSGIVDSSPWNISFYGCNRWTYSLPEWISFIEERLLYFSFNDSTTHQITRITRGENQIWKHLDPTRNYANPYTPQYAWSPATKKYVDQSGPCVPVYHLGGWNVMTSYINFDMAGWTYKVMIQWYHGTTINRTLTVTASSTVQWTFTSNLMEHYNYWCIVTIDPSVSTTMIIQIDSNSNFTVDDIYIEKINIQSWIVTATSIN